MQSFEIESAGFGQGAVLLALALFCLVIALVIWQPLRSQGGVVVVGYVGFLICVGVAAAMVWFYVGQMRANVEIGEGRLVVNIPMYGRTIPIERIRADEAERITLRGDEARRLAVRTNGLGVPGLNIGWFRTIGGERALVAVTTPEAVAVPTDDGYLLILSVTDADGFLSSLRRARE